MFGFKPKLRKSDSDTFAELHARFFPRVTLQEHEHAKSRVAAERQKMVLLQFPDGTRLPFYTGSVSWSDLTAADGYAATIEGYDRFGWPVGHPESPAAAQVP